MQQVKFGKIFNDLKLLKAAGTPEPDAWVGKVTSLEGLSILDPEHLIFMSESEQNVLEESNVWNNLQAVKNGKVYRITTKQNYNEAFYALGKQTFIEQIGKEIIEKNK